MASWPQQRCNSGLRHGSSLEDGVLHYFGCLKFSQRKSFISSLAADQEKLKDLIRDEELRVSKLRALFEDDGGNSEYGKLLTSFKIALSTRFPSLERRPAPPPPPTASSGRVGEDGGKSPTSKITDLDDLNANVIYFKNHEPYDHPDLLDSGTFPNQKVSLSLLLKKDAKRNPLMWPCEEGMIRYFHVPANNMAWIEEVIARYYNEDKPDLDGPYRKPKRGEPESKTRMLLRPQFWRGLQHGNKKDLPTHTRHMRPRCYVISTDHKHTERKPKNIVLFMPYLHWETDRRRARAAKIIKKTSHAKMAAVDDVVNATASTFIESTIERATSDGIPYTFQTRTETSRRKLATRPVTNKTIQGQSLLGRMLLLAATLYEAMDAHTDEMLIQRYLTATPPLHPRRTLDQSYYWTLKDTRKRDRDQVVYRGTAPNPTLMHHWCLKGKKGDKNVKPSCAQCIEDVKRVPRVIMCDQLWMWVLDENTVITSFPKRWGRNKPDPSAVQKCIRTRIQAARDDEIRSVYDLGIIIIDQCSRVFFDRTQSIDLQPQVMDSFDNAIGKVSHKTTIAFDHFWEFTRLTSKRYNAQEEGEPETRAVQNMQKTLLDINPEGALLREIKDILDELFIMTLIKNQEESVARTFFKLVRNIMLPSSSNSIRTHSDISLPDMRAPRPSFTLDSRPRLTFDQHVGDEGDLEFTMNLAMDLADSISDQLQELGYLKAAAERTEAALKDLMELKQQQAGVVEAREAVKQGEESLKQGRSIMLFTVVTIIFLPLSFFTAVFGMNATELIGPDGPFAFKNIFVYMIPISFVVSSTSLFLAFSKLSRAILSFGFNYAWAWALTRSGAYVTWHDKHMNSKTLKEQEKVLIDGMKSKALKAQAEKREEALLEAERREEEERMVERARGSLVGQVERAGRRKWKRTEEAELTKVTGERNGGLEAA